jgi:Uma2 family endonuclease
LGRVKLIIDQKTRRVEIYTQGQPKEVLESPTSLSGEDILPGFVLDLRIVWGLIKIQNQRCCIATFLQIL